MLVLDVNLLVAAHRGDHPQHVPARAWLDDLTRSRARFGVSSGVWGSVLRIATNRRAFVVPSPRGAVFDFVRAVRAQPGHQPCEPGPRHLELLERLCEEGDARADLVPDAVIAAVAAEHAASVATMDRDFARFPSVPHVLVATTPDR